MVPREQMPLLAGLDAVLSSKVEPERLEDALHAAGPGPIAAIDEAGRGPLAGPVVAAAVIFDGPCDIEGVNDSKQLMREERGRLVPLIQRRARAWGIGCASAEEIDEINILEATRLASMRALAACDLEPAVALTDALTLPALRCPVVPIIRGDARVRAIGAASILAKEHRDALMRRAGAEWPGFGLERHMGYPTPSHRAILLERGPTTFHRLTFNGARPRRRGRLIHSCSFLRWEAALRLGDRLALQEAEGLADLIPVRERMALRALLAP